MAGRSECNLAASTGVHDGQALIKQLLAGAHAVEIASTLYKNGMTRLPEILDELSSWMERQEFHPRRSSVDR